MRIVRLSDAHYDYISVLLAENDLNFGAKNKQAHNALLAFMDSSEANRKTKVVE